MLQIEGESTRSHSAGNSL